MRMDEQEEYKIPKWTFVLLVGIVAIMFVVGFFMGWI